MENSFVEYFTRNCVGVGVVVICVWDEIGVDLRIDQKFKDNVQCTSCRFANIVLNFIFPYAVIDVDGCNNNSRRMTHKTKR